MLGSSANSARTGLALDAIRIAVAILIFIHGAYRATGDGHVAGFGGFLESQGFPQGIYWAGAVTIYELVAPLFILARRFVALACLGHIGILALGAYLVHLPSGWFVVGGGRNGMEYSILLIVCLSAVAYAHFPASGKTKPTE
jgi:putative oxidoreductase